MAEIDLPRLCHAILRRHTVLFLMIVVCCVGTWILLMEWMNRSRNFPVNGENGRDLRQWPPEEGGLEALVPMDSLRAKAAHRHLFFLNTHKAGGALVRNALLLFARRHNLSVLLPRRGLCFSTRSKDYWHNKDPHSAGRHHDLLCDYLVFNQTFVTSLMPRDTLYVGIVRNPFEQFLAAFQKYSRVLPPKDNYLRTIPGPFPVATYLSDPARWEHPDPSRSFTNNRMSFDFGLNVEWWMNKSVVKDYLQYLEDTFHLVMVAERFDESLILLRRLAHWSLKDILYIQVSDFQLLKRYTFNESQRHTHRTFQYPDYALYEHFEAILYKKIGEQLNSGFLSELINFRRTREAVQVFCELAHGDDFVRIEPSVWNEAFVVTAEDCKFMTGRLPLVSRPLFAKTYDPEYYKEENQFLDTR